MTFSRLLAALLCAAPLTGCGDDSADTNECAPVKTIAEAVDVYGAAWNERDASRRDCLLARSVSPDLIYIDPTIDTTTAAGLSAAIADFQTSAPGASIVQLSELEVRYQELRFAWDFRLTDPATQVAQSAVKGVDYMEFSRDAQITHIRGYWEPLPPGPPEGALADYVAAWQSNLDAAARAALLDRVLGADPRFTSEDYDVRGAPAIADAIAASAPAHLDVVGVQRYPKFARVALELDGGNELQSVTDYLYLDDQGRITRIARFSGNLAPL